MDAEKSNRMRFAGILLLLILSALLLGGRLIYGGLANAERFPIHTIKVVASYEHLSRERIEGMVNPMLNESFFTFPVSRLRQSLSTMDWVEDVQIARIWPDTVRIRIEEKIPVAIWNDGLVDSKANVFNKGVSYTNSSLPVLKGPINQQQEVLQVYKKLSKILSTYDLHLAQVEWRDNHAYELVLTNGVMVRLGKCCLEQRIVRFCKAYPAVFAEKPEQIASVDLRYPHGMAVQWKP